MLGGGTFLTQNKALPGAYINFVSVAAARAELSDRGIATIALELDWCAEQSIFRVEQSDLIRESVRIFGHAYTDDELRPLRELFRHSRTVWLFRLNPATGGVKAQNTFATAKYTGTLGNSLKTVITASEDSTTEAPLYDVSTYLGTTLIDEQRNISQMSDLAANDFCTWKSAATLTTTAGTAFTGGTNGTVTAASHQTYLDQAESVTFNAMGCVSSESSVKELYVAYTRRMRDEVGKKFQLVLRSKLADHEGVVSVKNGLIDSADSTALVPWVLGVVAGTAVNASATGLPYDGEYDVDAGYTQTQLEAAIAEGSFTLHRVDDEICVLRDINTFTAFTDEKSEDFASNQVMRVLDQIANDIALLFAKRYLGKVPNDAGGRASFRSAVVTHHEELQRLRAIEDFKPERLTAEAGATRRAIALTDYVKPVTAMEQLYMYVYVQ